MVCFKNLSAKKMQSIFVYQRLQIDMFSIFVGAYMWNFETSPESLVNSLVFVIFQFLYLLRILCFYLFLFCITCNFSVLKQARQSKKSILCHQFFLTYNIIVFLRKYRYQIIFMNQKTMISRFRIFQNIFQKVLRHYSSLQKYFITNFINMVSTIGY